MEAATSIHMGWTKLPTPDIRRWLKKSEIETQPLASWKGDSEALRKMLYSYSLTYGSDGEDDGTMHVKMFDEAGRCLVKVAINEARTDIYVQIEGSVVGGESQDFHCFHQLKAELMWLFHSVHQMMRDFAYDNGVRHPYPLTPEYP
jgi:hypothetical protein